MHSSSRLFPVGLIRAEFAGDLNEDVYELNPQVSDDATVRVALTRVTVPAWEAPRQPIILLHGEFDNRRQWLSPEGSGFAARLAHEGFDVWLPEMRGHGLSPENKEWSTNTLSAIAVEDWPALQAFVIEQSGMAPLWVGAGLGGLSLGYALINVPAMGHGTAGVVFVDSATSHWSRRLRRLSIRQRWLVKCRGHADGQLLNWGVEREPWSLLTELQGWRDLRKTGQHPVWDQLRVIKAPSLVVGIRDEEDDARAFQGRLGSLSKNLLLDRQPRGSPGPRVVLGLAEAEVVNWLHHAALAEAATPSSNSGSFRCSDFML